MTNARQHAFGGRGAGIIELRLKDVSGGMIRVLISDDGIGLPDGMNWPQDGSLGGHIVDRLVDGVGAQLSVDARATATTVTIDMPVAQW